MADVFTSSDSFMQYPRFDFSIPYGTEHDLQTLDVILPRPLSTSSPADTVWIVFIHGGAWCDPEQDKTEIRPAADLLLSRAGECNHIDSIAGFASLNYGLSPRAEGGSHVPSHNLKHPAHLRDLIKAFAFLQQKYNVGKEVADASSPRSSWDYVAVGHSCGATMLVQLAMQIMGEEGGHSGFGRGVAKPKAMLLLEGIYDIPLMIKNHADIPAYRAIFVNAFGDDESTWTSVSPTFGSPATILAKVDKLVLAMSREDELVEWEQVEVMRAVLGEASEAASKLSFLEIKGKHDEIWQLGSELARAMRFCLDQLFMRR